MNNGGCFVYTLCRRRDNVVEPAHVGYLDEDQAHKEAKEQADDLHYFEWEVRTMWVPNRESYS